MRIPHNQAGVTSRATDTARRGQVQKAHGAWLPGSKPTIHLAGLADGDIVPSSLPMGNRLRLHS